MILEEIHKGTRRLVINFKDIDYINSAGLSVLLITAKQLKTLSRSFSVCAMSDKIRQVFEVSGFHKIILIHPHLEEALKA